MTQRYTGLDFTSLTSPTHAAHYLQERGDWNYNNRTRSIVFTATCDCGWVSDTFDVGRKAALAYAKHVGYENQYPCGECGK